MKDQEVLEMASRDEIRATLDEHFSNVTVEEFAENLRQYCPDLRPLGSPSQLSLRRNEEEMTQIKL
ncbi:MAG TPA: hypothetical protein VE685_25365, partial [Thermoanaerobaculia bacterium]|nr:hypothetical protein [Thermoanaerobaculia bacterium]